MTDISKFAWRYDAVVIGARCAGAATAMLLAKSGLRVLAIDRQGYRTDTLSTHALMRGGVVQLAKWRLLGDLARYGTPPVRQTVFGYGRDEYVIDIKPSSFIKINFSTANVTLNNNDSAISACTTHLYPKELRRTFWHSGAARIPGCLPALSRVQFAPFRMSTLTQDTKPKAAAMCKGVSPNMFGTWRAPCAIRYSMTSARSHLHA